MCTNTAPPPPPHPPFVRSTTTPKRRHRTRHFDDPATGPRSPPLPAPPKRWGAPAPAAAPPPLTVQALIGKGPSAERPPPPHCPGRPHDCVERRKMGPVQRPEGVCPPPPHHPTALSPIPPPPLPRPRHSPALVHVNRQRSVWGGRGFRLHFSPTPPYPRCRGHPVVCATEALACHTLRSALPCALRCGRGFSRPRHRSPCHRAPPPPPSHPQALLHKAQHNTKAAAWEFRFQSALPDALPLIFRPEAPLRGRSTQRTTIYFMGAAPGGGGGGSDSLRRMPSCTYAMVLRKCFWKVVSAAAHIQMNEWISPFPQQLQRVDGGQGAVCVGAVSDPMARPFVWTLQTTRRPWALPAEHVKICVYQRPLLGGGLSVAVSARDSSQCL